MWADGLARCCREVAGPLQCRPPQPACGGRCAPMPGLHPAKGRRRWRWERAYMCIAPQEQQLSGQQRRPRGSFGAAASCAHVATTHTPFAARAARCPCRCRRHACARGRRRRRRRRRRAAPRWGLGPMPQGPPGRGHHLHTPRQRTDCTQVACLCASRLPTYPRAPCACTPHLCVRQARICGLERCTRSAAYLCMDRPSREGVMAPPADSPLLRSLGPPAQPPPPRALAPPRSSPLGERGCCSRRRGRG